MLVSHAILGQAETVQKALCRKSCYGTVLTETDFRAALWILVGLEKSWRLIGIVFKGVTFASKTWQCEACVRPCKARPGGANSWRPAGINLQTVTFYHRMYPQ